MMDKPAKSSSARPWLSPRHLLIALLMFAVGGVIGAQDLVRSKLSGGKAGDSGTAGLALEGQEVSPGQTTDESAVDGQQVFSGKTSPDPDFVAVTLPDDSSLMVAKTEITVGQWNSCVAAQVCPDIASQDAVSDHPMVSINWQDVSLYASWLSQKTQLAMRVPSREEWLHFAAEHAPVKQEPLFDDPRMAWAADYDMSAVPQSHVTETVGSFGANHHNIYDLTGNVWEWVGECFPSQPGIDAQAQSCAGGRVLMGERMVSISERLRDPGNAGCGGGQPPTNIGFRLVYVPESVV